MIADIAPVRRWLFDRPHCVVEIEAIMRERVLCPCAHRRTLLRGDSGLPVLRGRVGRELLRVHPGRCHQLRFRHPRRRLHG